MVALLHLGFAPHQEAPPAGAVGVDDAVSPHDDSPRGEIGAGEELHELPQLGVFVVDEVAQGVHHLLHVVRGEVGGHAHSDARGPVHQEVRQGRGEHQGLLQGVVEVRPPVHGLFVEIRQDLFAHGMETALGVSHGRRGVPIDGPEVPLTGNQRVTEAKVLGHAGHGVVDGLIAVGVVLTHGLSHHAGGFLGGLIVPEPQLQHGEEDAALHGLEPVPGVGKGPPHDDAHGIIQVAMFDLFLERQRHHLAELQLPSHLFGHSRSSSASSLR